MCVLLVWTQPFSLQPPVQHCSITLSTNTLKGVRLIILVFMCTQWLISQRGGRLLRSQINWHYRQDRVPNFYSHDLTKICYFYITASNKSCTYWGVFQLLNHMNSCYKIRFWHKCQIYVLSQWKKAKQKSWLLSGRVQKKKEKLRVQVWLKSLQTISGRTDTKMKMRLFVTDSVHILTMSSVHIFYKNWDIKYWERNHMRRNSKRSMKGLCNVKKAIIRPYWIQCK